VRFRGDGARPSRHTGARGIDTPSAIDYERTLQVRRATRYTSAPKGMRLHPRSPIVAGIEPAIEGTVEEHLALEEAMR